MVINLSRNKRWKHTSPKVKNLFSENLPFDFKIAVGIALLIYYALPYILNWLFPSLKYLDYIVFSILGVYILYLVYYASKNYKNKTGKNLNEEIINLQNKHDLKNVEKRKMSRPSSYIFSILFLMVGLLISYFGLKNLLGEFNFGNFALLIVGVVIIFVCVLVLKGLRKG